MQKGPNGFPVFSAERTSFTDTSGDGSERDFAGVSGDGHGPIDSEDAMQSITVTPT
ncbi:hypothetical protein [Haladaptatus sp. NG-WS-4]